MHTSQEESFSLDSRLKQHFSAPVFETYGKNLHRRLKNFTSEDVRAGFGIILPLSASKPPY